LPKPPIRAGITTKNTMMSPCAVMKTFHSWPGSLAPARNCTPGSWSSMRMITEKSPPIMAATSDKVRYIVPMSLWLVELSHRVTPFGLWS
jgi:hypothetical protein